MNKLILSNLNRWYTDYVGAFHSSDSKYKINIDLKDQHTRNVRKEIINIGKSLNIGRNDLLIAEAIALLHDIGRFPQYDRYRTYSDSKSENHAQLGIELIKQHNVLSDVTIDIRNMMLRTIFYHNKRYLPEYETEQCLLFTKLLRDADKLDIFRVVTNHYLSKSKIHNEVLELELPDTPEISHDVIDDIIRGKTVNSENVKTLNDFKMLQMSWVYDINYAKTRRLIKKRYYIKTIYETLPNSDVVDEIYHKLISTLN